MTVAEDVALTAIGMLRSGGSAAGRADVSRSPRSSVRDVRVLSQARPFPDAAASPQESPSPDSVACLHDPHSPSGSMSSGYSYDAPQALAPDPPDRAYALVVGRAAASESPSSSSQEAIPPSLQVHPIEEPSLPLPPSPNPSSSGSSWSSEERYYLLRNMWGRQLI